MDSNLGFYNYSQLIIKRDNKNARKIIIPKKQSKKRIHKKLKTEASFFPQTGSYRLHGDEDTLIINQTSNEQVAQIYKPTSSKDFKDVNKKLSTSFDVILMETVLPWTFMSNLLREAAKDGNLNLVIDLIQNGAEINDADRFGIFKNYLLNVKILLF